MYSLQKLCFDIIVEKFERFCFTFTVTKDENLRRCFEFLHRKFFVHIASQLASNRKRRLMNIDYLKFSDELSRDWELIEKFFDFLINEHLTLLDGKWDGKIPMDLFCRLPNFIKIRHGGR